MYNKVIFMGYLARDFELAYTPTGVAYAKNSVASNRRWKDQAGETKEEVTFLDVIAWGKTAETVAQYLKKGNVFHFEGRLKQETWDDKETHQKRSKILAVVESFQFVPSGQRDTESKPALPSRKLDTSDYPPATPTNAAAPEEDDVPF